MNPLDALSVNVLDWTVAITLVLALAGALFLLWISWSE